jgi:hypothetical protein
MDEIRPASSQHLRGYHCTAAGLVARTHELLVSRTAEAPGRPVSGGSPVSVRPVFGGSCESAREAGNFAAPLF